MGFKLGSPFNIYNCIVQFHICLEIGEAIEHFVSSTRLSVVPAFTGHGIGRYFHGPPDIYPCRLLWLKTV